MINWLGATLLVAGFLALLKLFRLVETSRNVIDVVRQSLATLGSIDLSEDDKERIMQRNAVRLFGDFLLLAVAGAGALLLPVGGLWVLDRLGWLPLEPILRLTVSPLFLIVSTLIACAVLYWWGRRAHAKQDHQQGSDGGDRALSRASYSAADRLLHELAFSTYPMQTGLSKLEDRLLDADTLDRPVTRPVFITALPRAGTTLLLECCATADEFATHCYRDMPFVPLPYIWGRFARRFRRESEQRPRVHGDGMMISADSPEALEEVLWMLFWSEQYRPDRILPWPDDCDHRQFRAFFARQMNKVIHLRRGGAGSDPGGAGGDPERIGDGQLTYRYASKNNLNIARLGWLRQHFPDAVLLVPFRDPVEHAASLLRQHRNFLDIHAHDPFAATYMRAIGHFDFGVNLRPIDFDGWLDDRSCDDPRELGFWLEYWVAAYSHLLSLDCGVRLFAYEAFCQSGEQGLRDLAQVIGGQQPEALLCNAERLRPPRPHRADTNGVPESLLETAQALHTVLLSRASNRAESVASTGTAPSPGRHVQRSGGG